MKKYLSIALACLMILGSSLLFMSNSAKGAPVAAVYLYQSKGIYQNEVDRQLANLKKVADMQGAPLGATSKDVLESLIDQELLYQAAAQGGYELTQGELDTILAQTKQQLEAKAGRSIPEDELVKILSETYQSTMDEYKESVKRQYTIARYLEAEQAQKVAQTDIQKPTTAEIEDYYNRTIAEYIIPKRVQFASLSLLNEKRSETENYKLATKVASEVQSGALSFEDAVKKYSDDEISKDKGGLQGWLAYTDETNRQALGDGFFLELFALKNGQVSGVLKSNVGYHLVKVLDKGDAKLLTLADKLSLDPVNPMSVGDAISAALLRARGEEAKAVAYKAIIADLRNRASISYPRELK